MNIDEMPAGMEMDLLIAKKIMGWEGIPGNSPDGLPSFSSDIRAAWQVIEKLDELYAAWFEIRGPRGWVAQCNLPRHKQFSAAASTLALAICRVALKVARSNQHTRLGFNLTTAILSSLPGALQGELGEP